jgi:hypothetical protein
MFALHIDTLLFILLLGMAALLRLLASKVGEGKKKPPEPEESSAPTFTPRSDQLPEHAPEETDADRIRKFLEALGQPPTAKPPPPIVRHEVPPPLPHVYGQQVEEVQRPKQRRSILSPLPPLTTVPPPAKPLRRVTLPGQIIQPPYETKPFKPAVAEATLFEIREAPPPIEPERQQTPAEGYAAATRPVVRLEQAKTDIALLLGSSSGLRNAIILREIFGPPRSLQPVDLIGSA